MNISFGHKAALEMSPQPLHEQIQKFAKSAFGDAGVGLHQLSQNENRLKILPLFLLPGVHVMTDIPTEVALAQQAIGQDIIIDLQPHLGSHPNLEKLLAKQISTIKAEAWILLAHEVAVAQVPKKLWKQWRRVYQQWLLIGLEPPSLESRVKELVAAGYRRNCNFAILFIRRWNNLMRSGPP